MASPILTLTTDFGLSDHYVGAMKGVILGICARAHIVDISHQVTPFEIAEGAYLLAQAYGCFPKGTVHIAVVDPGVGSERRPILIEAAGQYFVGPDNGIFGLVLAREKHKVRAISDACYFRQPVSRTFHGRDIFAPVAANLAAGTPAARMGKIIRDFVKPESSAANKSFQVLHIDRFGNVVTTVPASEIAAFPVSLAIGSVKISTIARNYAERPPGELFLIEGSSGLIEVSINQGSAAQKIGCRVGTRVLLKPSMPRALLPRRRNEDVSPLAE